MRRAVVDECEAVERRGHPLFNQVALRREFAVPGGDIAGRPGPQPRGREARSGRLLVVPGDPVAHEVLAVQHRPGRRLRVLDDRAQPGDGTVAIDHRQPLGFALRGRRSRRRDHRRQPEGESDAEEYANLIGGVVTLCFFRSLTNLESKVRSSDGRIIRDWIASNHGPDGFWELVRLKHGATQIIFECKNYSDLEATDFHQISYYINDTIGLFGVIVFRGEEVKSHYYDHLKRVANDKKALVILLTDKDVDIFLRQAINGKSSEGHIQELYDRVVREIS